MTGESTVDSHPPRLPQDTMAVIDAAEGSVKQGNRFGTFSGVFTPSILTILGVVMYLRFGWVVGNVGLGGALLVVVIAHLITTATGLSISTIATNRTVGAGGAYNIISRSLGAPTGAAIGLPLFFGQALSVSFYVVGFTESIVALVPEAPFKPVAAGVCVVLGLVAMKSANFALKIQYVVMALIGLSLVSFFTGTTPYFPRTIEWTGPEGGESFAGVFAVFFPAVTGIMAGVGMSGDLDDPRRALPRGTMLAILAGFIVYMAFPIWLATNASMSSLQKNPQVVWEVSSVPALIYVGIWGATLSSAIGSLLTAPRTLQAVANDGILPRFLAKGHGPNNEPRAGAAVTFGLAMGGIMLGNLDVIANILTMFFLATYGLTNLACGLERWAASPSFRPEFRVPAWVSLLGALACFYVMSIIDLVAMIGALIVCLGIYALVQRRALGTTYGDARHGIWAAIVRMALFRLRRAEFHPQNWRPNLIILGGGLQHRPYLLQLGSAVVQDRGVVTYFHLLRGTVSENAGIRRELLDDLDHRVAQAFPNVFYRVDVVDDIYGGAVSTAQSYGLGNFEANTVMLGWPKDVSRFDGYAGMLRDLVALDRSLFIVNYRPERGFGQYRNIHIWWGGLQGNGGLMLLLAFLLMGDEHWKNANASLLVAVDTPEEKALVEHKIRRVLDSVRLRATPIVLLRNGRDVREIMREQSFGADLAIIGARIPGPEEPVGPYYERMSGLLANLPTTILVRSALTFSSEPVLLTP